MSGKVVMIRNVHLVGSVGLTSVEDVYSTVGPLLGSRLKRVPDGEPGGRRVWTTWQYPVLLGSPFLQIDETLPVGTLGPGLRRLRIADGVKTEELTFGELGYSREARSSYQDFVTARDRGEIHKESRFQVCMPTPINILTNMCASEAVLEIELKYEKAMGEEISRMCKAIPADDLCIQWDMVREMIWWDGRHNEQYVPPFADVRKSVLERLARISDFVPHNAELGFHLCYGDWGARHMFEPIDMGAMVSLANAICSAVQRPIAYVHMPVPIARVDDAFFSPLVGLDLPTETELYLGLVHLADGNEGTQARIQKAATYRRDFGIGTECGLGRCKTPKVVRQILELHARASS
jgi:hypothetical protein